jgi:protein tyrosine phosphatase (PTP) superfamily phosphohydrolase (DUF442 family)
MSSTRRLAFGIAAVGLGLVAVVLLWGFLRFNIGEVVPDRVYRSRQPTAKNIDGAARRFGLASVVNLRGPQPGEPWYDAEVEATGRLGLERLDLRFHSFDWPPRVEVRELVRFLDTGSFPTLLHCMSGVHRTGWASSVARVLAGDSPEEARSELSSARRTLKEAGRDFGEPFFDLYGRWLLESAQEHSPQVFRDWALEVYCPPPYNAEIQIEDATVGESPGAATSFRVRVTNRSPQAWTLSSALGEGIRLGATILGPFDSRPKDPLAEFRRPGRPGRDVGRAGVEDGVIEPGQARVFELAFNAPEKPGLYLVQLDMVEERVHWFSDLGTPGVIVDLRVSDPTAVPAETAPSEVVP